MIPTLSAVPLGSSVSPCCCETCCLYPYESGVVDITDEAEYPATLLVPAIDPINPFMRGTFPQLYTLTVGAKDYWIQKIDGVSGYAIMFFDNDDPGAGDQTYAETARCLVVGDGGKTPGDDTVEDQFPAQLSFDDMWGAVILTRVSLCRWVTDDLYGACEDSPAGINSVSAEVVWLDDCKFHLGIRYNWFETDPGACSEFIFSVHNSKVDGEFQNKPDGTYGPENNILVEPYTP